MKIEVWSDFVCPFCYIGKRRLEEALNQLPNMENIEVQFKSFELDPQAKRDYGKDIHTMLAEKFGTSYEQGKVMNDRMKEQAKEVGLTYNFDTMIPTNTFDAHRLMHFAHDHNKEAEMTERLLHAYFTESKHIGDHETLSELASEVGLDQNAVKTMLVGTDYADAVRADEQEARQLGVQGVPFFVLNRKYAISGAQPLNVFVEALQKVQQEEQPLTVLNPTTDEAGNNGECVDGACQVSPNKE
ncbi:putative DsbA family dithiol-disulfide isomerase [Pullulanibacillus pueri]|uniref:DSBA oxidoreductase n=1 Tax=Pullulanibacillus pueri TaxID=1437324 RepID=A0A8J2ZWG7_9BACL|nr:DsbA family oxidoreductase [Pullulanibacillus pueri]MBM7682416.1 putative DsbA family dithiol-disulfide isomerase [Pullulanibacillus pueri]GGH81725.1 DSBA oxidoreductase [Pullulanibacillus pueri]